MAAGTFTFTVQVQDSLGNTATQELTINVAAVAPGAPTAVSAVGGDGQAVVSWTAPASNGGAPITSYVITGTPGGSLTVSGTPPATTGTVQGLTNGTSYTFTVAAVNSAGTGPASSPTTAVIPQATLTILTTSLAPATIGAAYEATLNASGGVGARTWTITAGNLPAGLTLNESTGVISGTPTP